MAYSENMKSSNSSSGSTQSGGGKLNNHVSRFSRFTWGDCPKLREAISEARLKFEGRLPKRFKIKL